jgi:Cu/Ag efflux pump CusA
MPLEQLVHIQVVDAPASIKSEAAVPMIGGVATSVIVELIVFPAI